MSPETTSSNAKLCPTCGSRLSENATRCLVCGSEINPKAAARSAKPVQGSRMPEVTLSLPAALGFLALFIVVGAVIVYFGLRSFGRVADPTPVPTETMTATITATPTITPTATLEATATPLPPVAYKVASGDTCLSIAAAFKVSVNSIILLNQLPAECNTLVVGQTLQIPQPTPTPSPQPTATMNATEAADAACDKVDYTVKANDTLSSISLNYGISMEVIKEYNGLVSDTVYEGQPIVIPLCLRQAPGTTPTPTTPPPYGAPNLLLPADGAGFSLADDTITLQWSSVGTLRSNEAYAVTIEDVTAGNGKQVEYVTDQKYIVPTSLRPNESVPHVFRWSVVSVRQTGSDKDGNPIWQPAGDASAQRVFTWAGVAGGSTSPTSAPTP